MNAPSNKKPRDDRDLVGTTLAGKFQLLEFLGQGSLGSVFLAETASGATEKKLALRLFSPEWSRNEEVKSRLLVEIHHIKNISSKRIVPIHETGEAENGRLFLTMDHCPGERLDKILKREGKLAPPRAFSLVLRILEALNAAHAAGVLHRDLSPASVLVFQRDGREVPYVLDFGFAAAVRDTTGGAFGESVHYQAPEELLRKMPGFSSDLYSAGAILYECLTGQKPWRGMGAQDILQDQNTRPLLAPEQINPQLRAYPELSENIRRALAPDPSERYRSVKEFFLDLRAHLEAKPKQKPSRRVPPRVAAAARKHRGQRLVQASQKRISLGSLAVIGGLVVVVAVMGIAIAKKFSEPKKPVTTLVDRDRKASPRPSATYEKDAQQLVDGAERAYQGKRWTEVQELCSQAVQLNPANARAFWLKGEAELRLENPQAAIRSFGQAWRSVPAGDPDLPLLIVEACSAADILDREAKELDTKALMRLEDEYMSGEILGRVVELLDKRGAEETLISLLERTAARNVERAADLKSQYMEKLQKRYLARAEEKVAKAQKAFEGGNYQEAVESADAAIKFSQTTSHLSQDDLSRIYSQAFLLKGRAQMGTGFFEEALKSFERVWDLANPERPAGPELLIHIIQIHDRIQHPEEKTTLLRNRALEAYKTSHISHAQHTPQLFNFLDRPGNEREVILLVKFARERGVDLPVLQSLHKKYFEDEPKQREDKARALLAEAQKALTNLDHNQAKDLAEKGRELKPLPELGRPLDQAFIELGILHARALLEAGMAPEALGKLEEVRQETTAPEWLIEMDVLQGRTFLPDSPQLALEKFDALLEVLQQTTGLRDKGRMLEAETRTYRARCYALQKEWELVGSEIKRAIRAHDTDPGLIFHQAESYFFMAEGAEHPDRKRMSYEACKGRFLKVYTDFADTAVSREKSHGYYLLGRCYYELEEYTKAVQYYQKSESGLQDWADLYWAWGDAYVRLAEKHKGSKAYYRDAAKKYERYLEIKPNEEACLKSAMFYMASDDPIDAKKVLQKGLSLLPQNAKIEELQKKIEEGKEVFPKKQTLPIGIPVVILPTARMKVEMWRYSVRTPPQNWSQPDFNDAQWSSARAGFGAGSIPGVVISTPWRNPDIWLRRKFTFPQVENPNDATVNLLVFHNDDAEIFLNGTLAATLPGNSTDYLEIPLTQQAKGALWVGENTIAVHCRRTGGRQYIDVGMNVVRNPPRGR